MTATAAPQRQHPAPAILVGAVAVGACGVLGAAVRVGATFQLIVLLVVLAVSIVAWRHPVLAAAILGAAGAANAASVLTAYHGVPSVTEPLLLLTGASVAARSWRSGAPPRQPTPGLLVAPLGYLSVLALSVLWAGDRARATESFSGTVRDVIVALIIVSAVRTTRDLRIVLGALVGVGFGLGALATLQFARSDYSNEFGGFAQASIEQIVGALDGWRITGPFDDPNFFAQAMVVFFALSLGVVITRRRYDTMRLAALASSTASGLAVVFSFSRGGLLALLAVLAVAAILRPPSPRLAGGLAVVVLGAMTLLPHGYTDRTTESVNGVLGIGDSEEIADAAVRGRTSEVIVGLHMFRDHPVGGVGVGNYPDHYQEYSREVGLDPRRADRQPHSLGVQIASETGLVGLTAFGVILIGVAVSLRRALTVPETRDLAIGLVLAWAGFLTAAIFLHLDYGRTMWLLVVTSFAVGDMSRRIAAAPADGATTQHEVRVSP